MRADAVLLDVDGTLWDSTEVVAEAWTRALREAGITDHAVEPSDLKRMFGKTMKRIADELFEYVGIPLRYEILDRACVYEDEALEANMRDICYPGVKETIKTLSERIPVTIISNCQSGYIEQFLRKTGLGPYVKDIECYGNTGRGKDENIRLVAERNGFRSPVYIGDTQGDLEASRLAGIPFWWASYGFGSPAEYDIRLGQFSDLLDLIQE